MFWAECLIKNKAMPSLAVEHNKVVSDVSSENGNLDLAESTNRHLVGELSSFYINTHAQSGNLNANTYQKINTNKYGVLFYSAKDIYGRSYSS